MPQNRKNKKEPEKQPEKQKEKQIVEKVTEKPPEKQTKENSPAKQEAEKETAKPPVETVSKILDVKYEEEKQKGKIGQEISTALLTSQEKREKSRLFVTLGIIGVVIIAASLFAIPSRIFSVRGDIRKTVTATNGKEKWNVEGFIAEKTTMPGIEVKVQGLEGGKWLLMTKKPGLDNEWGDMIIRWEKGKLDIIGAGKDWGKDKDVAGNKEKYINALDAMINPTNVLKGSRKGSLVGKKTIDGEICKWYQVAEMTKEYKDNAGRAAYLITGGQTSDKEVTGGEIYIGTESRMVKKISLDYAAGSNFISKITFNYKNYE